MNKPMYQHDCDQCVYLGVVSHYGDIGDGYSCNDKEFIIRFGDDGDDYAARPLDLARRSAQTESTDGFPELVARWLLI